MSDKTPSDQTKPKRRQQVYTLMVQIGRKADDGLPEGSTGAALLCYSGGVDEGEAVRETVALLKTSGLAPLDVSSYGSLDERRAEGHDIPQEELELMYEALELNSVVVAQKTAFYDE